MCLYRRPCSDPAVARRYGTAFSLLGWGDCRAACCPMTTLIPLPRVAEAVRASDGHISVRDRIHEHRCFCHCSNAGAQAQIGGGTITRRTILGDLLYITLDGFQQFIIRDATGTLVPLGSEYRPAETDSSGTPVLAGCSVQLVRICLNCCNQGPKKVIK